MQWLEGNPMQRARIFVLAVPGILALHVALLRADTAPAPKDVMRARVAVWPDPRTRCPDVRQADPEDAMVAVVVLRVGSTGVPSKPSLEVSSGSKELDKAALECVMKLKYTPATGAGDGNPMDSSQRIAFKQVPTAAAAASSASGGTAGPAVVAAAGAAVTAAAVGSSRDAAGPSASKTAEVRACADAAGTLTQDPSLTRSSGDSGFDAAALGIARAASGHYRAASPDGKPAPGCVQLTIKSEGT
jgi:TonB family protein